MTHIFKICLLTALLLPLFGCSNLLSIHQDAQQLERLQHWQIQGKLSLRRQDEALTGYLTWKQHADRYDLFIAGPFGQGASRLKGTADSATLTLPGKDPVQGSSATHLMQRYMGWHFPVEDLRYWVKAQASPHSSASLQKDDNGLVSQLRQHQWLVQFSRYKQYGDTWLPGRIKMSGYGFKFTLAIKQWTLHD